MAKKSFILFNDSLSVLDELTDEQAGKLFKAIRDYQNGFEQELEFGLKMAFLPFKNQFIRDMTSYEELVEVNRIKGLKSAEARAKKAQQELTNSTDGSNGQPGSTESTYKDNDTDTDKEKDTVTDNVSSEGKPPGSDSSQTQIPNSEKTKRKVPPKEKESSAEAKKFTEWVIGKIAPVPVREATVPKIAPMYDKLIRAGYTKEDIKMAVEFAVSDEFWRQQFLSPMKLDTTDKNKEKFIDIFIAKAKLKAAGKPQQAEDKSSVAHLKVYE